ncbi:type II toxin-antitoxin system RelE/ParE family toxin [Pedobacter sp. SD-b]|uniref:Type II toxin-antitoxin system RelE/ParE family toxin n=1 Tax=Pedobacter segetis TaxID=2793069 RepID=A0ABS1BES2_9SPHI|nr:type II toxin-antitoxin system RelE/ParE family toxin [Pedobacter segetis]MBK0381363.1 type II toxin-antitoxin system RelE/ParE family toxin [Pedobacter segetis]
MSLDIAWTKEAEEIFELILNHLESNWSPKQAAKFFKSVNSTLLTISKQPFIFKASEDNPNVRKAAISKQTSFFYKVEGDKIIILYFWDNRQNPTF